MRRAVSRIVAGAVLLNLLGGVVWSFLAKPTHFLVVGGGLGQSVDGESLNEFGAPGWLAVIGIVFGVVVAGASWFLKAQRGVWLLVTVVGSAAVGSLTMAAVGELIVRLRFPEADNPAVGSTISVAPTLFDGSFPVSVVLEPLVAAAVILVLAALSPFDDLGSGRAKLPELAGVEHQG